MAEKMEDYISDYAKILEKRSYEDFERYQVWMHQELERLGKVRTTMLKENVALANENNVLANENNVLANENSVLAEKKIILEKENTQLKRSRLEERVKVIGNLIKLGFNIDTAIETLEIPENQRDELKKLIESYN